VAAGPIPSPPLLDDIRGEALRVARAAVDAALPIRLMGGLAVWALAPSVRTGPYARDYRDMDFAAASRAGRREVGAFFERVGYVPEKLFNALHGAQRLNFAAPDGRWTIDVVFDELNMSHRVDLRDRLALPGPTLDPADLLLTKLQVWEINRKDLGDIACLLADLPLGQGPGGEAIDARRVASVTSTDWGICHTVERNLDRVRAQWKAEPVAGTRFDAAAQAAALELAIRDAPKSLAWRARARVGERVRWYEIPEEVRHQA
jgi:hypothetical protein